MLRVRSASRNPDPSFVPGKSVVIQGKTTRFEGFALGTTEHKDTHKKIRLWAGVLFDKQG
jgi:hypothetical protein